MKNLVIIISFLLVAFNIQAQTDDARIKVLNIGMFHMGQTSDATSTEYDESAESSRKEIKEINELIARFKPTIILVEEQPKYQQELEEAYHAYLKDQTVQTPFAASETQILGFEIGRLAGTKRIYGIDHKMSYNYMLDDLAKEINAEKYFQSMKVLETKMKDIDLDISKIGLKKMISIINSQEAKNFLINVNADALTLINSEDSFEGADEAAKLYHRNLRMFANINKIKMDKDDRVMIISGGAHAAFFHQFLTRSYIYEIVDVEDYLK